MVSLSQGAALIGVSAHPRARIALRDFILFQLVFWGAFLTIRIVGAAFYYPELLLQYMGPRIAAVAAYAGATTLVHLVASRLTDWTALPRLAPVLILCALLLFPLHSFEALLTRLYSSWPAERAEQFINYFMSFGWIFAAWAGYYYALDLVAETRAQARALAAAQANAQSARVKMLRYQLNPHFLFNSLNAISTLVLEGRNADAEKMILNLSRFLRHTIDTDPSQLSRLGDEIHVQRLYMEIEAARFGDRLQIQCEMAPGFDDCLVPSLLLQPIVENAIKHGVSHNSAKGWIRIASEAEGARLRFIIEDNGPGPAEDSHESEGVGLRNTRERLAAIYGGAASLKLVRRLEGGARAVLEIPLIHGN
jgi:anti-sigma regulatory factor (Ser/Thr protein kinase)